MSGAMAAVLKYLSEINPFTIDYEMKAKYGIIISALAVLTLAGCRETPPEEPEGDCISFGAAAATSAQDTRSTLINTASELQGQAFGVYGKKSEDDSTNFENVFGSSAAQKVYYSTSAWTYDNLQKWERWKHYRFRAYWPYTANVNTASNAKFIGVEYKQVENYDLMVAYATRCPLEDGTTEDPTGTRVVRMQFHHTLAGMRFKFKFDANLRGVSDYATSLYVTGLYSAGTMIYGESNKGDKAETLRWNINEENAFDKTSHFFDWSGSKDFGIDSNGNSTEATVLDDPDHVGFVIPQTLSDSEYERETLIHFTTSSGGTAEQSVKIPKNLKLEPGKIYTFTLVIKGSSVKVNVHIEDWTETQSNVDIYF